MYPEENQPGSQTPGQPAPQQPADPYQPNAQPAQSAIQPTPQPIQPMPGAQPRQPVVPAQPDQYSTTPMPSYSMQQTMPGRSLNKRRLIALMAVIVVVALGVAAYFMLSNNSDTNKKTNKAASDSSNATNATSLGALKGVTFNAPTLDGYTLNSASTATAKIYAKGDCSLQFGTADEKGLPGSNLGDIVDRQIKALRNNGVTITGPDAGTAIVLKSATDSNKRYSMPTLIFKASKGSDYVMSRYSVVIFASGQRAFVTRACTAKNQPVTSAAVDAIDRDAARITIAAQ